MAWNPSLSLQTSLSRKPETMQRRHWWSCRPQGLHASHLTRLLRSSGASSHVYRPRRALDMDTPAARVGRLPEHGRVWEGPEADGLPQHYQRSTACKDARDLPCFPPLRVCGIDRSVDAKNGDPDRRLLACSPTPPVGQPSWSPPYSALIWRAAPAGTLAKATSVGMHVGSNGAWSTSRLIPRRTLGRGGRLPHASHSTLPREGRA